MTGCQAEPRHYHDEHCAIESEGTSLILNFDAYGVDEPSHSRIAARLQEQPQITTLQVVINYDISQKPQQLYRYLRGLGIPVLQFIPLIAVDDAGNLTTKSVRAEAWGTFLIAIFDLWVQNDIDQIRIQLIDSALDIWRGKASSSPGDDTFLAGECRECPVLRFCQGDCPENRIVDDGKSVLCAGYSRFFTYSAPYMKAMRDLLKQHRSPMELMAMLAQSRSE